MREKGKKEEKGNRQGPKRTGRPAKIPTGVLLSFQPLSDGVPVSFVYVRSSIIHSLSSPFFGQHATVCTYIIPENGTD